MLLLITFSKKKKKKSVRWHVKTQAKQRNVFCFLAEICNLNLQQKENTFVSFVFNIPATADPALTRLAPLAPAGPPGPGPPVPRVKPPRAARSPSEGLPNL